MQGPWAVETACLGMRAFQLGDEAELKKIASDSEFVKAVRETLEAHGVDAADVHEWVESREMLPIAIVLKHTGQLIGVYSSVPVLEGERIKGAEGVFILRSEEYAQGFASELAQASLDAAQARLSKVGGGASCSKPSYSLQGSVMKRCHGAAVVGFKFTVKECGSC